MNDVCKKAAEKGWLVDKRKVHFRADRISVINPWLYKDVITVFSIDSIIDSIEDQIILDPSYTLDEVLDIVSRTAKLKQTVNIVLGDTAVEGVMLD